MISVTCSLPIRKDDGSQLEYGDISEICRQIKGDSIYGTFGEIPDSFWDDEKELLQFTDFINTVVEVIPHDVPSKPTEGFYHCKFELHFDEGFFKPQEGGIQQLIGILAGDLFYLSMPGYCFSEVSITNIDYGGFLDTCRQAFCNHRQNGIQHVRESFQLQDGEPLLAFSIKPRVGLSMEKLKQVAIGVAEAGVNIIEMDTRFVLSNEFELQNLIDIAREVSEIGDAKRRKCRFSPNFSFDSGRALPLIQKFVEASQDPAVIKIDFSLDGLATLQAVRKSNDIEVQPIITCYPLLKSVFSKFLPNNSIIELLSANGVDIMYPGGCPEFTKRGTRHLDRSNVRLGQQRYIDIIGAGQYMPSVAGGVHASELHAYYELLGPNAAYFIGGGIALHNKGPAEGAKLCRKIIDEAIKLRRNDHSSAPQSFSGGLSSTHENFHTPAKYSKNVFDYVDPSSAFEELNVQSFFQRFN